MGAEQAKTEVRITNKNPELLQFSGFFITFTLHNLYSISHFGGILLFSLVLNLKCI